MANKIPAPGGGPSYVPRPKRRTGAVVPCAHCGQGFYRRKCEVDRRFCSAGCGNMHKRKYAPTMRECATCGAGFVASDKPHSNSAGRYCSLACRNRGYVGKYRGQPAHYTRGNRPGWRSIANRHKADGNGFCIRCGTSKGRLLVHHIEPYRVQQNNERLNLVTACTACHPKLERWSERIARMPSHARPTAVAIVSGVLGDSWCIHSGRRILAETSR